MKNLAFIFGTILAMLLTPTATADGAYRIGTVEYPANSGNFYVAAGAVAGVNSGAPGMADSMCDAAVNRLTTALGGGTIRTGSGFVQCNENPKTGNSSLPDQAFDDECLVVVLNEASGGDNFLGDSSFGSIGVGKAGNCEDAYRNAISEATGCLIAGANCNPLPLNSDNDLYLTDGSATQCDGGGTCDYPPEITPTCDADSVDNGSGCECDASRNYFGDTPGSCTQCTSNDRWNGAACECDESRNYFGTAGSCVQCNSEEVWNGTECECDADNRYYGEANNCQECATDHELANNMCACHSTATEFADSCDCPTGYLLTSETDETVMCETCDGLNRVTSTRVGSSCLQCREGYIHPDDTEANGTDRGLGACIQCDASENKTSNYITAANGQIYRNACVCIDGYNDTDNPGTCVPDIECTNPGEVADEAGTMCVCDQANNHFGTPGSCDECPSGQSPDENGMCEATADCNISQFRNTENNMCECNANTRPVTNSIADPPITFCTCTDNYGPTTDNTMEPLICDTCENLNRITRTGDLCGVCNPGFYHPGDRSGEGNSGIGECTRCVDGSIPNSLPDGANTLQNACICTGEGAIWDAETNTCGCPDGMRIGAGSGNCVMDCPANSSPANTSDRCLCDPFHSMSVDDDGNMACQSCEYLNRGIADSESVVCGGCLSDGDDLSNNRFYIRTAFPITVDYVHPNNHGGINSFDGQCQACGDNATANAAQTECICNTEDDGSTLFAKSSGEFYNCSICVDGYNNAENFNQCVENVDCTGENEIGLSAAGNRCECEEGYTDAGNPGTCELNVVCDNIGETADPETNLCVCDSENFFGGTINNCVCQGDRNNNDNPEVCVPNSAPLCADNQKLDDTMENCICVDNTIDTNPAEDILTCELCGDNQQLNANKDACVCVANAVDSNPAADILTCELCADNEIPNEQNVCVCKNGFSDDGNTCLPNPECGVNQELNAEQSACVCVANAIDPDITDVFLNCELCGNNAEPNADQSACVCQSGYADENNDDICIVQCPGDNQMADEDGNVCLCQSGFVQDPAETDLACIAFQLSPSFLLAGDGTTTDSAFVIETAAVDALLITLAPDVNAANYEYSKSSGSGELSVTDEGVVYFNTIPPGGDYHIVIMAAAAATSTLSAAENAVDSAADSDNVAANVAQNPSLITIYFSVAAPPETSNEVISSYKDDRYYVLVPLVGLGVYLTYLLFAEADSLQWTPSYSFYGRNADFSYSVASRWHAASDNWHFYWQTSYGNREQLVYGSGLSYNSGIFSAALDSEAIEDDESALDLSLSANQAWGIWQLGGGYNFGLQMSATETDTQNYLNITARYTLDRWILSATANTDGKASAARLNYIYRF